MSKVIELFTDGSCMKKKSGMLCGYGIHFHNIDNIILKDPDRPIKDISRPFHHPPLTNQRAELYAIYVSLIEIKNKTEFDSIIIYSDSMYSIETLTKWAKSWEKNGWKTADNGNVKNTDIIMPLYDIVKKLGTKIKFIHVMSHTGNKDFQSVGNDIVDKLAVKGAYRMDDIIKGGQIKKFLTPIGSKNKKK